jgi:hypothetical protein
MPEHRKPRPSLSKPSTPDNLTSELNDLYYLLRDSLGRADAFITAAERLIEESWSRDDDDRGVEDETDDESVSRRRSRAEHLIEAGKMAVRAATYITEEIDRRRRGA